MTVVIATLSIALVLALVLVLSLVHILWRDR